MEITEENQFEVITKYFNERGPVFHQLESYEYLVNVFIQKIVDEIPDIKLSSSTMMYHSRFGQVYVGSASFLDEKNEIEKILPSDARVRNITYDCCISVDTVEEFWEYDEKMEDFEKVETKKSSKIPLFRLPVMVGSSKCNLYNMNQDERVKNGECENCPGGYFIVNGKERALIFQERINYNQVYVFDSSDKFSFVSEIRSMSEETGHSALVQLKINHQKRGMVFSLPYMSKDIKAGAVFKALGFISKEIFMFVNPQTEDEIYLTDCMIRESMEFKNKEEALKYLSISTQKIEDEDESRRVIYTKQVIENELFPHMGISTNTDKVILLGTMVNKLIKVSLGLRPVDNRDNVSLKRIEGPCILFGDLIRMSLKRFCDTLKKYLEKRQDIVSGIARTSNSITVGLKSACSTGNWTVQKNTYMRTGVSQIMSRLTYSATVSHLRRVVIPIGKEGKNIKIRQIDPSQVFFIDVICSPEGKSIGIVKNLALLACVTTGCNSVLIRSIVESIPDIFSTDKYLNLGPSVHIVYVNGNILGLTVHPSKIMDCLDTLRREKVFSEQVSYIFDELEQEIRIFCDGGRYIRPLFTLEGKNLKIKSKNVNDLTWSKLVEEGYVRYIDSNEVEQSVIAMNISDLSKFPENNYNYCEIHPSTMLGVCSSVIPYPEHNQSPRLVYQSSMFKQALGVYSLSYQSRFDTVSHVLHYPQKPLVQTRYDKMLKYDEMLSGCNPIVAIACYGSYNVEDSLIWNKSSVDRGMFVHTCYKTITTDESKKVNNSFEKIEVPLKELRLNGSDYSKLDDKTGIVKKGAHVYKGDIIIGKTLTKTKKDDEEKTECSVSVAAGEEGIVDDVWEGINENRERIVKVKIRQLRTPEVGDKCACFDESTQILTEYGWKFGRDLLMTDKFATLQNDELVYENPLNLFQYDYNGKMYHVNTPYLNMLVTPNHKLYVADSPQGTYKFIEASDAYGKKLYHKSNVTFSCDMRQSSVVLDFFTVPAYNHPIDFYPSKNICMNSWLVFLGRCYKYGVPMGLLCPISMSLEIKDFFSEIGLDKYTIHNLGYSCYIYIQDNQILEKSKIYSILPCYMWKLNSHQSLLFLNECIQSYSNGQKKIRVNSLSLLNNFQRLILQAGLSSTYSKTSLNKYTINIIYSNTNVVNKNDEWLPYTGKVYCVEVPGNIIYIKRKKMATWSGNSRSSQKGVCGQMLSQEDMPFTRDGIVPDLIMNPHGMPSRMTMSQLLECLGGKTSALTGKFTDATAFSTASIDPVENIANNLKKFGFQKYGNERLYSGYTGEILDAEIFIGPTYYQRLKHLVKDKWHSRARGNNTVMHNQPNEGRANDGALRLGEMERDVLIATGASKFLLESTYTLSDVYQVDVCGGCGNILSAEKTCRVCQDQSKSNVGTVDIPYCCKLLFQELESMGVKIKINIK